MVLHIKSMEHVLDDRELLEKFLAQDFNVTISSLFLEIAAFDDGTAAAVHAPAGLLVLLYQPAQVEQLFICLNRARVLQQGDRFDSRVVEVPSVNAQQKTEETVDLQEKTVGREFRRLGLLKATLDPKKLVLFLLP